MVRSVRNVRMVLTKSAVMKKRSQMLSSRERKVEYLEKILVAITENPSMTP